MRYEYNKQYKQMLVNEGLLDTVKKAFDKVKRKLSKPQYILLQKIIPMMVATGIMGGPQLMNIISSTAEKLHIELDAEEITHLIHLIEHTLEHTMHIFSSTETSDDDVIL